MTNRERKIKDLAIQLFLQDYEGWLTGGNSQEEWFLLTGTQQARYIEVATLVFRIGMPSVADIFK